MFIPIKVELIYHKTYDLIPFQARTIDLITLLETNFGNDLIVY